MTMTKKPVSRILSGLLWVQVLLAAVAVAAVIIKDRPGRHHASYLTAMTTPDIAWR